MARPTSIVMLTHNQLKYTQMCIDALREHSTDCELVIIDNASTDETPAYLRQLESSADNVLVAYNDVNVGYAAGCNQGAAMATHDAILLLNNDTIPFPGWLDALRGELVDGVGAVGARLLFPNNTLQHAGIYFHIVGLEPTMYAPAHRFPSQPADFPAANRCEAVAGVTGACLLTTREVWDRVGGMDDGYVMAVYEDVDFNLKVRDNGWQVIYQPAATLIHFQNTTINSKKGTDEDVMLYKDRNFMRLNEKWRDKLAGGLAEV